MRKVNASNHTKCTSLINLLFMGRCNTFNDLSNKVCVPNKRQDLNVSMFNGIAETNESKT